MQRTIEINKNHEIEKRIVRGKSLKAICEKTKKLFPEVQDWSLKPYLSKSGQYLIGTLPNGYVAVPNL